jgi:hypothetical protein
LAFVRRVSRLLDSAFRVPGTEFRFGWDPIVGLVPGAGEFVAASFGALVLLQAVRLGVPRIVLLRMLLNLAIDLVAGAVPVLGDLFDFAWKANDRNYALLMRHERPGVPASSGDWAFVGAILTALASAALFIVLGAAWLVIAAVRLLSP